MYRSSCGLIEPWRGYKVLPLFVCIPPNIFESLQSDSETKNYLACGQKRPVHCVLPYCVQGIRGSRFQWPMLYGDGQERANIKLNVIFFFLSMVLYSNTSKTKKKKYVKLFKAYRALHLQNWQSGTWVLRMSTLTLCLCLDSDMYRTRLKCLPNPRKKPGG